MESKKPHTTREVDKALKKPVRDLRTEHMTPKEIKEFKEWAKRLAEAFVRNLNRNVLNDNK